MTSLLRRWLPLKLGLLREIPPKMGYLIVVKTSIGISKLLSLTLRIHLNWCQNTLPVKPLSLCPLSLGPNGPLASTTLTTGRSLASDPLLHLGSQLTLCITVLLKLSLILFSKQIYLDNISETTKPLNRHHPPDAKNQPILKHVCQNIVHQIQIGNQRGQLTNRYSYLVTDILPSYRFTNSCLFLLYNVAVMNYLSKVVSNSYLVPCRFWCST